MQASIGPRASIRQQARRGMLTGPTYSSRLRGFVVDEAHCILNGISKSYNVAILMREIHFIIIIIFIGEIPFAQLYIA